MRGLLLISLALLGGCSSVAPSSKVAMAKYSIDNGKPIFSPILVESHSFSEPVPVGVIPFDSRSVYVEVDGDCVPAVAGIRGVVVDDVSAADVIYRISVLQYGRASLRDLKAYYGFPYRPAPSVGLSVISASDVGAASVATLAVIGVSAAPFVPFAKDSARLGYRSGRLPDDSSTVSFVSAKITASYRSQLVHPVSTDSTPSQWIDRLEGVMLLAVDGDLSLLCHSPKS